MAGLALVPTVPLPADALARLTAWAEATGAALRPARPGAPPLTAVVEAFAAGHPAVLLVGPDPPPDALLSLSADELAAPMAAVLGPDAEGRLAVVGLTEIVPALLAPGLRLADALNVAFATGLSPVVLPEP